MPEKEQIVEILTAVKDPEIPTLHIVEMGIVRDVEVENEKVTVTITPTYSGCPAMKMIEEEIGEVLQKSGIAEFAVKVSLAPAWTTDWISESAKQKLKESGIAPPEKVPAGDLLKFSYRDKKVSCPFCDDEDTQLKSEFGSTPCKALHYCNACQQPFEHFKCI